MHLLSFRRSIGYFLQKKNKNTITEPISNKQILILKKIKDDKSESEFFVHIHVYNIRMTFQYTIKRSTDI